MKLLEVLLILGLPLAAFGAGWKTHGDIGRQASAVVVTRELFASPAHQNFANALCHLDVEYLTTHSAGLMAQVNWAQVPPEAVGACQTTRYIGALDVDAETRVHLFVLRDRLGRDQLRAIEFDESGHAVWIR